MSHQEAPQGYRYHLSGQSEPALATFEVVPALSSILDLALAGEFQAIRLDALRGAYSRADFDDDELAQSMSPHDSELVAEEAAQIKKAADTERPYMYARFPGLAPHPPGPDGQSIGFVAGFGHVEQVKVDGVLGHLRAKLSRKPAPTAIFDIGTVFTGTGMQRKGVAHAQWLSMTDVLPDAAQVTAHIPAINRGAKLLLVDRLGFKISDDQSGQPRMVHGKSFNYTRYEGPLVGEFRQLLLDLYPGFNSREPI